VKTLKVERMGDVVQGIRLRGDPELRPEPEHVRIVFPGGDVDVARTDDGSYWVHVRVDREEDVLGESADVVGQLVDARLDIKGKHASECDAGDFAHPELYHLAVRVARRKS
jgi:hypothetical protein